MQFIKGEKFIQLSDFIFNIIGGLDEYYNLENTFDVKKIEEFNGVPIIYTHIQFVSQLFNILYSMKKNCIVISHNNDALTPNIRIPDCVIKWYSMNVSYIHPKLESIPVGIENSLWYKEIRKEEKLKLKIKEEKNYKNLLFICHNINTNKKERLEPYVLFSDKTWATVIAGQNPQNFDKYLDNAYNHYFTLSPVGNAPESHRLWETLYLGNIPIVKKNINYTFYEDLPICFVNEWNEINEDFLKKELKRIKETNWNLEKIDFNYWEKIIKSV